MTTEKHAREMHQAFRVLAQFNGINVMREVSPDNAIIAWRFLGHPLRDYLIACAAIGKRIGEAETDRVQPTSWLERMLNVANSDYEPLVDAVTLRGGVELQLTTKAIDVLAERAAAKKPIFVPSDPGAIERRVHVREKEGDKRLIFGRAKEVDRAGPVTLVDYGGRRLARFTINASGLETVAGWYVSTGGGGGLARGGQQDDKGSPTSDLLPRPGSARPGGRR